MEMVAFHIAALGGRGFLRKFSSIVRDKTEEERGVGGFLARRGPRVEHCARAPNCGR